MHSRRHRFFLLLLLLAAALAVAAWHAHRTGAGRRLWLPFVRREPPRTLDAALAECGPAARERLRARFAAASAPYPPARIWLIGLKAEERLELFAGETPESARRIADYPILAGSGGPGPKLREGDRQVPEGVYPVTFLNPNSAYHLSLRLGYPNAEDLRHAAAEGRTNPGGDIMIHGKAVSIGCLAMGDPAVEELFTLAADTGIGSVEVLIAPHDLRVLPPPDLPNAPAWLPARYADLAARLARFAR